MASTFDNDSFDPEGAETQDGSDAGSKRGKGRKNTPLKAVAPNWFRLGYLIHDVSRMRRTVFDQYMKPEALPGRNGGFWRICRDTRAMGS